MPAHVPFIRSFLVLVEWAATARITSEMTQSEQTTLQHQGPECMSVQGVGCVSVNLVYGSKQRWLVWHILQRQQQHQGPQRRAIKIPKHSAAKAPKHMGV
eukprot:1161295-Pelagomonas_calceolata.AAC.3